MYRSEFELYSHGQSERVVHFSNTATSSGVLTQPLLQLEFQKLYPIEDPSSRFVSEADTCAEHKNRQVLSRSLLCLVSRGRHSGLGCRT